jgi:general secretion pathway protein G
VSERAIRVKRVHRRRRRSESGFTLIELLVVIAILGVLAGIVAFNVTGVSDRGQLAACKTEVTNVQTALDAWRVTPGPNGGAQPNGSMATAPPAGGVDALYPTFLHTQPTVSGSCTNYSIDANFTVHAQAKDPNKTAVP